MAYATKELIEADFKEMTFSDTTNVKSADVTQFIVEADALIDAFVGKAYVVPVTAGGGLELLKLLSRSLVAARIKRLMEVVQAKATDGNQNILSVLLSKTDVMDILKKLAEKSMALEGATPLISGGGFFNKNKSCGVKPVMKKDTKQW